MSVPKGKDHYLGGLTHCKRGHELAGLNLDVRPEGYRRCIACNRAQTYLHNHLRRYGTQWTEGDLQSLADEKYEEILKGRRSQ